WPRSSLSGASYLVQKCDRNHGHYRLLQQIGKPKISPAPPRVFLLIQIFPTGLLRSRGGPWPSVPGGRPSQPHAAPLPQQPDNERTIITRDGSKVRRGETREPRMAGGEVPTASVRIGSSRGLGHTAREVSCWERSARAAGAILARMA